MFNLLQLLKPEFLLFITITNISIKSCCLCESCTAGNNQKTIKRYFIPPNALIKRNNNLFEKQLPNHSKVIQQMPYFKEQLPVRKKPDQNYYLDSGIDIDVPLNIMWADCNCAILSIYRYFLSNKFFYDRIINKTTSKYEKLLFTTEDQKNRFFERSAPKDIELNVFLDKNYEILKEAITKKKNYNELIKQATGAVKRYIDNIDDVHCFPDFLWLYCAEDFQVFSLDSTALLCRHYIRNDNYEQIVNGFLHDEIKIVGKHIVFLNSLNRKIKIKDELKIKQYDGSVKTYEVIGIFGFAGNYSIDENGDIVSSIAGCDYCLIVPVYDKNKNKVGYTKYQFNKRSEIRDLDYFYDLKTFCGFGNPLFYQIIYREKE